MEMSNLLMDVIVDILSRLPVKTLLRFKCVSRTWCALIESRNFIEMHLNRSIKTNSNLSLILNPSKKSYSNLSLILRHEEIYAIDFDLLDAAVELDHPLRDPCLTNVLGSCNGLLLLGNIEKGLAIWNPSTRKCHKFPDSPIHTPNYSHYCRYANYGLGYDSISDDYKLLRIVQFYCEEYDCFSSEVKLYSLKSNLWRRIQDFPFYLCFGRGGGGVLAGGALHWVVKQSLEPDMPKLIGAFDIGVEEYRLVPQPEYLDGFLQMGIDLMGGCLSVTCSDCKGHLDIWIMKDYGVKESWTKLLSVVPPPSIQSSIYLKPLAYSKSGGEILLDYEGKRFLWYDLTGKLVKEVTVHGVPSSFNVVVCVGSLVPLNGYVQIDWGEQHRHEKRNRKKRHDFLSEGFKLVL